MIQIISGKLAKCGNNNSKPCLVRMKFPGAQFLKIHMKFLCSKRAIVWALINFWIEFFFFWKFWVEFSSFVMKVNSKELLYICNLENSVRFLQRFVFQVENQARTCCHYRITFSRRRLHSNLAVGKPASRFTLFCYSNLNLLLICLILKNYP